MPDSVLFRFFNELGIIQQLSVNAFEKRMPEGLKISQFTVLNHFVRLGDGKTPLQLASAFQVTKGAMTNTLNRLLDRELVEIRPDPKDGRSKRVYITKMGRDMREECIKQMGPLLIKLQSEIGGDSFEKTLPFLEKLRKFLDENRDA